MLLSAPECSSRRALAFRSQVLRALCALRATPHWAQHAPPALDSLTADLYLDAMTAQISSGVATSEASATSAASAASAASHSERSWALRDALWRESSLDSAGSGGSGGSGSYAGSSGVGSGGSYAGGSPETGGWHVATGGGSAAGSVAASSVAGSGASSECGSLAATRPPSAAGSIAVEQMHIDDFHAATSGADGSPAGRCGLHEHARRAGHEPAHEHGCASLNALDESLLVGDELLSLWNGDAESVEASMIESHEVELHEMLC